MDIGRWHATGTLVNVEKLNALPDYATSPLFSEKDKALLDYVCELTRDKQVKPETFSHLASFYPEREICEIVYLVASEHVYNITNLGLNIHSDMLCELKQRVSG
jgi:alkylhydroperoxidase family enzyme